MEPEHHSFAEALHEAHVSLLGDLQELDEAVRPGSGQGPAELGTRLGKVRAHLLDHFRFEEEGGYMAPVLKEEPRLAPEAQELLNEHGQLAQALNGLIQEVSGAGSLEEAVRDRVRAWVKQVRHHEAQENHIVQEAYYSGGATGD
jgi:hypothetical protein